MIKHQVDRMMSLRTIFFNNLSYKIVSLFVALILWISILGRRDFVTVKEMNVKFVIAPGYSLTSQSHDKIQVKLSGSQAVLKKYKDTLKTLVFDLTDSGEGFLEIDIPNNRIDVPGGIKVMNVKPNVIKLEISKK